MTKCSICKETYFWGEHKCKPKWYCIHADDYGTGFPPIEFMTDEGKQTYARDAEQAAINFAERYQGENSWYPSEMTVMVMDADQEKIYKFTVDQEAVPSYSVHYSNKPEIAIAVHEEQVAEEGA